MGLVRSGLDKHLPDNAHELCTGRLFICKFDGFS